MAKTETKNTDASEKSAVVEKDAANATAVAEAQEAYEKGEAKEHKIKIFFRMYAMAISWFLFFYTFYNLKRFRAIANEKGMDDMYLNFLYCCLAFSTAGVTYIGFKAILYPNSVGKMTEAEKARKMGNTTGRQKAKKTE